jgi:hypothetical protein
MMLSDGGTTSGDLLVERAAAVFDVPSMKPDLAAGDSDHIRAGADIGVRHKQQPFGCCAGCWLLVALAGGWALVLGAG